MLIYAKVKPILFKCKNTKKQPLSLSNTYESGWSVKLSKRMIHHH